MYMWDILVLLIFLHQKCIAFSVEVCDIAYPVEVSIGAFWHIIIKHNVNSFYVNATSKEIRCNQDSFAEILKSFILGQSKYGGWEEKYERPSMPTISARQYTSPAGPSPCECKWLENSDTYLHRVSYITHLYRESYTFLVPKLYVRPLDLAQRSRRRQGLPRSLIKGGILRNSLEE